MGSEPKFLLAFLLSFIIVGLVAALFAPRVTEYRKRLINIPSVPDNLPLPAGWRLPSSAEIAQEGWGSDPNQHLMVKADFNGDGAIDQARLLVRAQGSGFGLFAFVSQKGEVFKTYSLDEKESKSTSNALGIAVVPPGQAVTTCRQGYFNCAEGESDKILLRHPAIGYFKEESAKTYFYWDEATATFKRGE